jgi:hypothetical protein
MIVVVAAAAVALLVVVVAAARRAEPATHDGATEGPGAEVMVLAQPPESEPAAA